MLKLYDSKTRQIVPLEQRDPGKVSIYVCGPTVYGPPHLGHGRSGIVYDVLRRFLTWSGLDVVFVSNITDIDDKIIDRAVSEDRDSADVAVECEEIWWQAMDRINVGRPDHTPHATDYVDQMIDLVSELVENGRAYKLPDGVYLSVEQVDDYGALANQDLDSLMTGGGEREVVGSESKKNPADFALWKLAKPGEPSWPSPWGDGRPGWHTECVAMSLDILGEGFDLHTGGLDLVFPHHENERAQAVALGKKFSNHWMHHGFVELEGQKMSKSLGNVADLVELTEQYDPRCYRLLILQSHYRSPIEITDKTLNNAESAVDRLDNFARRTQPLFGADEAWLDSAAEEVVTQFTEAMENDLDTAAAVDIMFRQVRDSNSLLDANKPDQAKSTAASAHVIAEALGLDLGAGNVDIPDEVMALVEQRIEARKSKDFERSDDLRSQLDSMGWLVEDSGAESTVIAK